MRRRLPLKGVTMMTKMVMGALLAGVMGAGPALADDVPGTAETYANRQELDSRMELLTRAMEDLSERERHILTERRLIDEPKTLEELSDQYGVSRERIRQIEVRAFEKLQKTMKRLAKEQGLPVGD